MLDPRWEAVEVVEAVWAFTVRAFWTSHTAFAFEIPKSDIKPWHCPTASLDSESVTFKVFIDPAMLGKIKAEIE